MGRGLDRFHLRPGDGGQIGGQATSRVGLCKILSTLGIASLRISLSYHDARMPPELTRADYIVSANVVRTLQVCRQAVRVLPCGHYSTSAAPFKFLDAWYLGRFLATKL